MYNETISADFLITALREICEELFDLNKTQVEMLEGQQDETEIKEIQEKILEYDGRLDELVYAIRRYEDSN